jgi:phosphatidylethanolamine-binding protein (PEBP) family uncharacterized protein
MTTSPRIPMPAPILAAIVLALTITGCGDSERTEEHDGALVQEDGGSGHEDGGSGGFTLTSSAFQDGGTLPVDYTCDGAGGSPPLAWTGVPAGTAELALLMTTLSPDGMKWNWVLYHIPTSATSLPAGATGVGTAGVTSDGPLLQYYPPCSSGPGPKEYTFTLYALSAAPSFSVPAAQVSGPIVTDAVGSLTLASSVVTVTYTR